MKKNIVIVSRILISVFCTAAVVFFLFICFSKYTETISPVKFGATYMTMNNPYFQVLDTTISRLISDYGDILISRDPAQDQDRQNEQILEMLSDGISLLFVNPVDYTRIKPALAACGEYGVPVFLIDTDVMNLTDVASVIQSDNYMAGVQCAEDMMSKKQGGAKILVLYDAQISSTRARYNGFFRTIQGRDEYEVAGVIADVSEIEAATEKLDAFLGGQIDFDVIFACNDPTALGSLAALQLHNIQDDVLIYGVDGSPDVKSMIAKGFITGTAAQYPIKMGKIAAETAYRYLNGQNIPSQILVDTDMLVKENLDLYNLGGWQ